MSDSLTLLRIEHKLDLLLSALQVAGIVIPPGHIPQLKSYDGDACPVCGQEIKILLDLSNEAYQRTCGCRPPQPIVPGISSVGEPPTSTTSKENSDGSGTAE